MGPLVSFTSPAEGIQNVSNVVTHDSIKLKIRCVNLCAELAPSCNVPDERCPIVGNVLRKALQIPCCVVQLRNSSNHPSFQTPITPRRLAFISLGRQYR